MKQPLGDWTHILREVSQSPTSCGQVADYLATPDGKSGRHYVVNVLSQKNRIFSPDSGFFRIFFKSRCSLDHSWQLLLNKVCHNLISLGGDRARTLQTPYVVTHTTSGIYILIINPNLPKYNCYRSNPNGKSSWNCCLPFVTNRI